MAFTTRKSLLSKIREGGEIGWEEFHEAYEPLIRLRGSDHGLNPSERDELVQDTVLELFKSGAVMRYDPERGRFRDYLKRIVDRRAFAVMRARARHADAQSNATGGSGLPDDVDGASSPPELEARWDEEWRGHVLRQALAELRPTMEPEAYQAFDLHAVRGLSAREAAEFLGCTEAAVYSARHRALAKLREIVKKLDE